MERQQGSVLKIESNIPARMCGTVGNLIEERNASNSVLNTYLYGAAEIVERITGATKRFYFQDGLGSTSHFAEEAGALLESYKYGTFGQQTVYAPNGTVRTGGTIHDIRHLFTGQLWMPQAGLYDYRHRAYSPTLTRFLQPDPIGFAGDPSHLYRYCENDPVNWVDPSGLITVYGRPVNTEDRDSGPSMGSNGLGILGGGGDVSQGMLLNGIPEEQFDWDAWAADDPNAGAPDGHTPDVTVWSGRPPNAGVPGGGGGPGGGSILDSVQLGLDLIGLVPVIGEPADAINASIYAYRGDYVNASLSVGAIIPTGGQAFTGAKLANKAARYGSSPLGRPFTKHYGTETGPVRNIPGSVVDQTIATTRGVPGPNGTTVHYDPVNDVTVVVGDGGAIVSARKGPP